MAKKTSSPYWDGEIFIDHFGSAWITAISASGNIGARCVGKHAKLTEEERIRCGGEPKDRVKIARAKKAAKARWSNTKKVEEVER